MERFMKRHASRIVGSIAGFDRILFRGNLSSICHLGGMDRFLSSLRIRYKEFGEFAKMISNQIRDHAQEFANREGRPYIYLYSSKQSKEDEARAIAERDQISNGLICIFSCVEPCQASRSERTLGQNISIWQSVSASVFICIFTLSTESLALCI